MFMDMIGQKRNREEREKEVYQKLNVPYKEEEEYLMSYILSQIQYEYTDPIQYYFSFGDISEDITVFCLWGNMPLFDGIILSFSQKIEMNEISNWVNFGRKRGVFDFFSNIQCLLNVDTETLRKMIFFENGKYGFICKGKKDYFLLMNIKSLDKFDYIDTYSNYCQFWLIKLDDKNLLDILKLKPFNETVIKLSEQIEEFKNIIQQKDIILQKQISEYNDRVKLIIKQKNEDFKELLQQIAQLSKEKNELSEKFEKKNKILKPKYFLGLKIYKDFFSIIEENNVISVEEMVSDEEESSESNKKDDNTICLVCFKNQRNILFESCGHCCICSICLQQFEHKLNKKTNKMEYYCPICNLETKRERTSTREIFLC